METFPTIKGQQIAGVQRGNKNKLHLAGPIMSAPTNFDTNSISGLFLNTRKY